MDDGKAENCFTRNLERKIFFSFKEVPQRKIFFPQINLYQNLDDT
jgi:hypothetical protein